jgi:PAS domain S-box-containing protein
MECNKKFDWKNLLSQHPIFSNLSEKEKNWFISENLSHDFKCHKGFEIIKEGELSDSIYLIGSGSVRVVLKVDEGYEITLSTLKKGEFFGEIAAIQQKPRSATVIAQEDSVFLEIKSSVFLKILEEHSIIAAKVLLLLSERLRRDITERKKAEKALKESEARYRTLLGAIPDPVVVYDPNGIATYVNEAFVRVYGCSSEELTGNRIDFVPPEETDATQEALKRALEDGTAFFETKRFKKNKDLLDVQVRTTILRDNEGKHISSIVIHHDITALKQAERSLQKARDDLELRVEKRTMELAKANKELRDKIKERKQAQKEKLELERQMLHAQKLESLGVLAGGIAHDFNNILAAILGNADLALHILSPMSLVHENLKAIVEASKRAAAISRQMLAYSGKGKFIIEPIDAGNVIREMAHLLEVSISKNAVINYNIIENLPTFDGDVTQIRQVIMNLITNASEAISDKHGVINLSTGVIDCDRAYLDNVNEILRARLDEPLPEGVYIYIEVADTGCGMDEKTKERIFDPFFTTKFAGRGLGMSAVLGIVSGHKGALKISSKVNEGTTFTILFPANEPTDNRLAVGRKGENGRIAWCGSGTVLIVDDEEALCAVVEQMLDHMGFSVLTASNGQEALKVFDQHANEIVCVLLDLTMPHMDGVEAFNAMRRLEHDVTVILCSGYNEQEATQRFGRKGLAGFIQKPYEMAVLREKLKEVLRTKSEALGRPSLSGVEDQDA